MSQTPCFPDRRGEKGSRVSFLIWIVCYVLLPSACGCLCPLASVVVMDWPRPGPAEFQASIFPFPTDPPREVQPREARMKELASCRGRGAYCGLMPLLLACVVSTPVSGAQQEESGRSASVRSCEAAFLQQRTLLTKQI